MKQLVEPPLPVYLLTDDIFCIFYQSLTWLWSKFGKLFFICYCSSLRFADIGLFIRHSVFVHSSPKVSSQQSSVMIDLILRGLNFIWTIAAS